MRCFGVFIARSCGAHSSMLIIMLGSFTSLGELATVSETRAAIGGTIAPGIDLACRRVHHTPACTCAYNVVKIRASERARERERNNVRRYIYIYIYIYINHMLHRWGRFGAQVGESDAIEPSPTKRRRPQVAKVPRRVKLALSR